MTSKTKRLVEAAVLIAVASALSVLKLIDMPYGGSVTVASMLPIIIIAYRHGTGFGLLAATAYGAVQQLLGLKNLSYVTGWQSVLAVIVLDYLLAFAVLGFGGVFRKTRLKQAEALTLGALLGGTLRFVFHVVAGATVWAGLPLPTGGALAYSVSYNASYMLPEIIVLCIAAYYVGAFIDLRRDVPTRFRRAETAAGFGLKLAAGPILAVGVIADVVLIFSHLQNAETGEFALNQLSEVKWVTVIIITAVSLIAAAACFFAGRAAEKRSGPDNG